jgi:nitroimidazol reductase NimA-like FMN-containing flavoprotein (pyridoxamine 5'-phosphate oxidase superfamily)
MSETVGDSMDDLEIRQFLTQEGLGVLGLACDDESYTIPIAFAYDEDANRCIFRFLATGDSRKMEYVSETTTASLTAYQWHSPEDWRSVVLRGPLSRLADGEMAAAAALFSDLGAQSALDVFNDPVSTYDTGWYEMRIDEMTGRGRFD